MFFLDPRLPVLRSVCVRAKHCTQKGEDPVPCSIGTYNPLFEQDERDDCVACPAGSFCYVEVSLSLCIRRRRCRRCGKVVVHGTIGLKISSVAVSLAHEYKLRASPTLVGRKKDITLRVVYTACYCWKDCRLRARARSSWDECTIPWMNEVSAIRKLLNALVFCLRAFGYHIPTWITRGSATSASTRAPPASSA